jgi:hypothetical protein
VDRENIQGQLMWLAQAGPRKQFRVYVTPDDVFDLQVWESIEGQTVKISHSFRIRMSGAERFWDVLTRIQTIAAEMAHGDTPLDASSDMNNDKRAQKAHRQVPPGP